MSPLQTEGALDVLPDISIVIVNYNVKDYLLQCLDSIKRASKDITVEVIVVDNNSIDGSVEELQPKFNWVHWIALQENIGFGRANNVGMQHVRSNYLLYLNPDTIIAEDTLRVMVDYMNANADVGIAGCKVLNGDGSFQVACRRGLPTPWVSFCKLFGLQGLFPQSKLFAGYNLTYKSIDETYEVDALIGAFMVGRTSVLKQIGGFDPQFFMYGEDIDLCYRIQKLGLKVMYVHTTSIIHYKGESTRRSSLNEVKVFYSAMHIFAAKHFNGSSLYLWLLTVGIWLRTAVEYVLRRKIELSYFILDTLIVLTSFLVATKIRFLGFFALPDFAYPLVLIVVPVVVAGALVALGEYVEYKPTIRRTLAGLMVAFFVLASLTYFFKDYAFSRGVLLMTIGMSAIGMTLVRSIVALWQTVRGKSAARRILLVGATEATSRIIAGLQTAEHRNANIVGIVQHGHFGGQSFDGYPILGSTDFISKLVEQYDIHEVIIADADVDQVLAMHIMHQCGRLGARFHMATEYDTIVTARIINDVAGIEPTVVSTPLAKFRNKTVKRIFDIIVGALGLVVSFPARTLQNTQAVNSWDTWKKVLKGTMSVVGTYPDGKQRASTKLGVFGLVHLSNPKVLSPQAIEHLNNFYVERYSISLDIEILLKHLLKKSSGNERYPRV